MGAGVTDHSITFRESISSSIGQTAPRPEARGTGSAASSSSVIISPHLLSRRGGTTGVLVRAQTPSQQKGIRRRPRPRPGHRLNSLHDSRPRRVARDESHGEGAPSNSGVADDRKYKPVLLAISTKARKTRMTRTAGPDRWTLRGLPTNRVPSDPRKSRGGML